MINVRHYDEEGKLTSERRFNTPAEVSAFYRKNPKDGCWNCRNYDPYRGACTTGWNNGDDTYYNPDLDDRDPTDWCKQHETDPDADWNDFGGDK